MTPRSTRPALVRAITATLVSLALLALAACDPGTAQRPAGRERGPGGAGTLTARPLGDTDAALGYYEYVPTRSEDGSAWPLLVFLHGYDESGDGSARDLGKLLATGIPQLIAEGRWPSDRPFLVLVPQHALPRPGTQDPAYVSCGLREHPGSCAMAVQHRKGSPPGDSPCTTPTEIAGFLAYALHHYDVDPERVYLTGLSCGAFGAYEYLAEHGAERGAAVVAIAGHARPAWRAAGCRLGAVPVWAFHGGADDVAHSAGSTRPLRRLT